MVDEFLVDISTYHVHKKTRKSALGLYLTSFEARPNLEETKRR